MNFQLNLFLLIGFLFFGRNVSAQVQFISPLPSGILQVHGNHADLHLHAVMSGYSSFSYKLISGANSSDTLKPWIPVRIINDAVDTLITVPSKLQNYKLYSKAVSNSIPVFDTI